jgi:hypothetical protein
VAFLFSGQAYSVTAPRVTARHGHGHGTARHGTARHGTARHGSVPATGKQAYFIFTVGKFYMNEAAFSDTKI